MRIPDAFLATVGFLGQRTEGAATAFRGSAFFVEVQDNASVPPDRYLVTARHNLFDAAAASSRIGLVLRPWQAEGERDDVPIPAASSWDFPEDDAVDLAVLPHWQFDMPHGVAAIPIHDFAGDSVLRDNNVGPGEEVFMIGLFTGGGFTRAERPIVRMGSIAAMNDSPMVDNGGRTYQVFLIEARSHGGLSGSPVWTARSRPRGDNVITEARLLGVVRGHWETASVQASGVATPELNMGIAQVTPIQPLVELLMSRAAFAARRKARGAR